MQIINLTDLPEEAEQKIRDCKTNFQILIEQRIDEI
jgi:hypothetical protein